ncbi:LysE family translocator [Parasulfitobacter algicola]|uniref:LysE family translocator n=1 Tax=Parasulfitobacter algicola TaxID=2614809 RepID=A0ABX2IUJ0_9RHOB|nr:LysE family translocator [Sulfitobacter algicola]NSX55676.1 LysE family translocator [Sulfitobacter algicola]
MTWAILGSIALIHLAAAISPGPSFVVSVKTAAAEGFRVAAALAVGFGLGALIWALAALLGLAVLFKVMPQLLMALKIIGGIFLCFIAFMMWRHANDPIDVIENDAPPRTMLSAVRLGLVTQLANPKPAVFFGAVFIGLVPEGSSLASLSLILAIIFINETLWYVIVAKTFSTHTARNAYTKFKAWVDRAFGGLIALFGLKIALG